MVIYQWGIFWANLNPVMGSMQAGNRPVLVISTEEANQVLPIISVVSLTSLKPGRKLYPLEVILPKHETGLSKDSIAMAYQLRSISKERLGDKCGSVENEEIKEAISNAVKVYLDIE